MKRLWFRSLEVRSFYGGRFAKAVEGLESGLNAVVGANASGKSTLAKASMRVLNPELAKGTDRVCAELVLESEGEAAEVFAADVDKKTKEVAWPVSRRPDLYRLSIEELMAGPGGGDTRVIREAFAGGVDLRELFEYVNKRAPSLAGVVKGMSEAEREAARIAEQEAEAEALEGERVRLKEGLREREALEGFAAARGAEEAVARLEAELAGMREREPGVERQVEDAVERVEHAVGRWQRAKASVEAARRGVEPYGGRAALPRMPSEAELLEGEARDAELAELESQRRTAELRREEAEARLNRWELTLPESYHPTDELGVLEMLDSGRLPGIQDALRERVAERDALRREAALREEAPAVPGTGLLVLAGMMVAGVAGAAGGAVVQGRPEAPYLVALAGGAGVLLLGLVMARVRLEGRRRAAVAGLRERAEAVDVAGPEAELAEAAAAFEAAGGGRLGTGYALDLAVRRAREVCEARLAVYRAREACGALAERVEGLRGGREMFLAGYGEGLKTGAELRRRVNLLRERETLEAEAAAVEEEVRELLERFGVTEAGVAGLDRLRERQGMAERYRGRVKEAELARHEAERAAGRVRISEEMLARHGLEWTALAEAVEAAVAGLGGLEAELERVEETLQTIRTQVEVLERGGGRSGAEWMARVGEADVFLQGFLERRAEFRVREVLEEAVRRENTPEVIRGLEVWLGRFTQGRYVRPEVREGALVISDTRAAHPVHAVEELSTGTRVHLALAVRLAVIERAENQGVRFPLFLDDVFAVSDPGAVMALRGAVAEIQRDRQVILLTPNAADVEGLGGRRVRL